jgi:MYXO-CTERM domain-containing protein
VLYDQWVINMAAEPDAFLSTITAPAMLAPDGVANGAVVVTVCNRTGQPLAGLTVTLSNTGDGTLSGVADIGDGTYSATLTAPTTAGTDEISAQVQGPTRTVDIEETATVVYGYYIVPEKKKSGCQLSSENSSGLWTVLLVAAGLGLAWYVRRRRRASC